MFKRKLLWLIPGIILLVAVLVVLIFAKPAAPKNLKIFAGPEGSTYYTYAQKYADFMRERDVTVEIVETSGSFENIHALAEEEQPAAAFALSGVDRRIEDVDGIENLESLGCLSFQPFWLFVRAGSDLEDTQDLAGLRVALGQSETDTRAIATLALAAKGVRHEVIEPSITNQSPQAIADALIQGELDAVFLVGMPHSAGVSKLLESDAVQPISVGRIEAYTRLYPEVGQVRIPEGLYDIARNIPDTALDLISPADNLIVKNDLHPAVIDLLLDAAREIHREPTLFGDRGTFPNMRYVSFPMNAAAVRFYEQGPSPWRKYLPYWLASLISRFAWIMAQVGAVVVVLLKGIPALARARFNIKSVAFYRRMDTLEQRLMAGGDFDQSMAELNEIHGSVVSLKAPRALLPEYLELRQNVHDLRERMAVWHEDHSAAS